MIKALMKNADGATAWTRGIGMIHMRGEAGWVIIDHPSNHYPAEYNRYRDEPPVDEPKPRPQEAWQAQGVKDCKKQS